MDSRLWSVDRDEKIVTHFHYDHTDDSITMTDEQDVTDIVERNRFLLNERDTGWKGDDHHVASIPAVIWYELQAQGIAQDHTRLKAWLNDPDNRAFRTKPGML